MAASEITAQQIVRTGNGTEVTLAAANVDGNYYNNGTQRSLRIKNAGTGSLTLTVLFDDSKDIDGVDIGGKAYTIPDDSAIYEFEPFPQNDYGKIVNLTYSTVTNITVGVGYYN